MFLYYLVLIMTILLLKFLFFLLLSKVNCQLGIWLLLPIFALEDASVDKLMASFVLVELSSIH